MTQLPEVGTIGVTPTFGNWRDRFVARAIQWFTATRDSYSGAYTNAPVNHAVLYIGPVPGHDSGYPQLVEAQPGGASFGRWDKYGDSMIWLDDIRQEVPLGDGPLGLRLVPTPAQQTIIRGYAIDSAVKHIGYNYLDFAAIALAQRRFGKLRDWWGAKGYPWWVQRLSRGDRLICSQLADTAWAKAGLHIFADERPSGLVSPEDLYMAGGAPKHEQAA